MRTWFFTGSLRSLPSNAAIMSISDTMSVMSSSSEEELWAFANASARQLMGFDTLAQVVGDAVLAALRKLDTGANARWLACDS